ncbi:hypothetical protein E2C01_060671 [Portunus trituberculatus]|uniref:Uncharacterized protein n=1 Tax=Portunus trituberculatus TaxID=210409 RepID=A0A5B7H8S1_PORTR|nr:hypothetical protein [Portunus trituberculatus]
MMISAPCEVLAGPSRLALGSVAVRAAVILFLQYCASHYRPRGSRGKQCSAHNVSSASITYG